MDKYKINYDDYSDEELDAMIENDEIDGEDYTRYLLHDTFNKRGKLLVSATEFFYKDKVDAISFNILAEIVARLKMEKYSDDQIAKIFGINGTPDVTDYICAIFTESFVIRNPRDIVKLWELLQYAHDPDYDSPIWTPDVEEEYIVAKVINNAIVKMVDNEVPTSIIINVLAVDGEEIYTAHKRGLLDIYQRANEEDLSDLDEEYAARVEKEIQEQLDHKVQDPPSN